MGWPMFKRDSIEPTIPGRLLDTWQSSCDTYTVLSTRLTHIPTTLEHAGVKHPLRIWTGYNQTLNQFGI
jgi:hypothetical protein